MLEKNINLLKKIKDEIEESVSAGSDSFLTELLDEINENIDRLIIYLEDEDKSFR